MQQFHEPIRQSAAHLYISAIPLMLPSSVLFKTYAHTLQDIPKLISGAVTSSAAKNFQGEAACSPDRRRFVIANSNNTLSIWDIERCYPIGEPLVGHDEPISRIRFSDDGTKFCSLDRGGRVLVWDAITYKAIGVPLQQSNTYGCIFEIGFVGDSMVGLAGDSRRGHYWLEDRLVAGSSEQVCHWEIATGNLVASFELGIDEFVHFEGPFLVWTAEVNRVTKIVNTITGEDVTNKYTYGQVIRRLKVSSDNKSMACQYDDVIRTFDVHSGDIIGDSIMFNFGLISFSINGRRLIVVRARDISIYDVETGKLLHGPLEVAYDESCGREISGVELSLDETRLVIWTSGRLMSDSSFHVLDVQCAKIIATSTPRNGYYNWCAISFDGTSIVGWGCREVTVFDINLLPAPHCADNSIASITPSPTGQQLLFTFSNNNIRLSDANANMDVSSTPLLDGARPPAAFSTNGSTVVSSGMDHALLLWNSKDAKTMGKPLRGHHSTITAVAFSHGCRLISASVDGNIFIWNVSSGVGDFIRKIQKKLTGLSRLIS